MQVDPFKLKLKPPGTKRLKLNCDILLSTFAFKFILRRYTEAYVAAIRVQSRVPASDTSSMDSAAAPTAYTGSAATDAYSPSAAAAAAADPRMSAAWLPAGAHTRPLFSST